MWTDQNRVYAAFMGVIDGYLEVDRGWEQALIKGCGKRIAESKRLHIRFPTKCVCDCSKVQRKCTVSNHRGFTWYSQKSTTISRWQWHTYTLLLCRPTHIKTPASVPYATHSVLRVAVSLITLEMNWVPAVVIPHRIWAPQPRSEGHI